jgi:GntR family transcriptional regulator / MocR family aminotransferase
MPSICCCYLRQAPLAAIIIDQTKNFSLNMPDAIIYLDPDSKLNLQNQIRQNLVDGILNGVFSPGTKLPSSRKLAEQLGIARNTVVMAYQQLIAEGYLVSRQRSGIFVNQEIVDARVGYSDDSSPERAVENAVWRRRIKGSASVRNLAADPPNWRKYPYPFIDGKFDSSLFPLAEWRAANRLSLSVADVRDWSTGGGDADDPMLIEEIRTKILTRRGIQARPDEILITMGTQNSLYLLSQLLADKSVTAAVEEPGNSELRELLHQRNTTVIPQPVDKNGILVDEKLKDCDLVYVTPSHQIPTAVCMSLERRQSLVKAAEDNDFLIIEDDYECETSYLDHPQAALRSIDGNGRVIYVASFSKVLAPGIRLGYIVANAPFIKRAREFRRTMLNHPPLNNQRTAAFFLSLGHYDSLMLRLGRVFRERRLALRNALSEIRGIPMEMSPEVGGTTYWVRTPKEFNVQRLAEEAARQGILVEPVEHYYAVRENAENCFRMGVTSVPAEDVRAGVTKLVTLIRSLVKGQVEHLSTSSGDWLTGDELSRTMSGATFLYREFYGVPCTIELHADGSMSGRRGFANEESDTGRWWVDGERWHRKWKRWVYGEETAYFVVIDGDKIKWFNADRQIVDSSYIRLADHAS